MIYGYGALGNSRGCQKPDVVVARVGRARAFDLGLVRQAASATALTAHTTAHPGDCAPCVLDSPCPTMGDDGVGGGAKATAGEGGRVFRSSCINVSQQELCLFEPTVRSATPASRACASQTPARLHALPRPREPLEQRFPPR